MMTETDKGKEGLEKETEIDWWDTRSGEIDQRERGSLPDKRVGNENGEGLEVKTHALGQPAGNEKVGKHQICKDFESVVVDHHIHPPWYRGKEIGKKRESETEGGKIQERTKVKIDKGGKSVG